jgi:hypothetical protein
MDNTSLSVAVEGLPDEAVVSSLCDDLEIPLGIVIVKYGKGNLDKSLVGYNAAAKWSYWLVLRDLDQDAPCPGQLKSQLLPRPAPHMLFRIAVRAVEAWLLADADKIAGFLRISKARIPPQPESLDDPKRTLIDLARRSRSRDIREDMVPRAGSGASEGPAYASRLAEFALYHWRPNVARNCSRSLGRCMDRLITLSVRK